MPPTVQEDANSHNNVQHELAPSSDSSSNCECMNGVEGIVEKLQKTYDYRGQSQQDVIVVQSCTNNNTITRGEMHAMDIAWSGSHSKGLVVVLVAVFVI